MCWEEAVSSRSSSTTAVPSGTMISSVESGKSGARTGASLAPVPVSTSDERKLVWSKMGAAGFEGTAEMLKKRSCFFHMAVKSNHFFQNGIISSFL